MSPVPTLPTVTALVACDVAATTATTDYLTATPTSVATTMVSTTAARATTLAWPRPRLLPLDDDSFECSEPPLLETLRHDVARATSSSSVSLRLAMLFPLLRLIRSSEGLSQPINSSTVMVSKSSSVLIDAVICSNFGGRARRNHQTISSLYSHPRMANWFTIWPMHAPKSSTDSLSLNVSKSNSLLRELALAYVRG
jgi:hypothetical protein